MKTRLSLVIFVLLLAAAAQAQNLEAILNSMDQAAANFRTAQTDFVWDQYQKVVDEHDTQKGTMYFRRQGGEVQMAADITSPDKKYVLFSGGMLSVYVPTAEQVTEYNAGKNKADFETFLVLGFGGAGRDLQKQFDVKYAGMEQVQGVNAGKLELDTQVGEGPQHVRADHALDRPGARRQRAAEIPGAFGRLPPGHVQQHPAQQENQRRRLQAENHEQNEVRPAEWVGSLAVSYQPSAKVARVCHHERSEGSALGGRANKALIWAMRVKNRSLAPLVMTRLKTLDDSKKADANPALFLAES